MHQKSSGADWSLPSLQHTKDHRRYLASLLTPINFKYYLPLSVIVAVMTSIGAFVHIFRRTVNSIPFVSIFANALKGSDCIDASSIVVTIVSSFVALVHIRLLVGVAVVVDVIVFSLRSVKSFVSVLVVVVLVLVILLLLLLFLGVWTGFLGNRSASRSLSLSRRFSRTLRRSLRRALCWTLVWTLVLVLSFLLAWTSWTSLWRHFLDWSPSWLVEPLCWWTSFLAVIGIVVGVVAVDGIIV